MGSAIGNTSPGRDRGPRVYDVRDFGAVSKTVSNPANKVANLRAFQLAHDTAAAQKGVSSGATIYVPSGDWHLAGPVFVDRSGIEFIGDGPNVTTVYNNGYSDIFILGMERQPTGAPATADHFPDAFTGGPGGTRIYDATAVTAPGQRWGIRTKADAHVSQQGGPLDRGRGDGYRTTRQLTIAVYIDFTLAGTTIPPGYGAPLFPRSGSLMGMLTQNSGTPWVMVVGNGIIYIALSMVDANGLNRVGAFFSVYGLPANPGLVKLDVQIDLVAAQISAYVNGVQVAVGALPAGFTAAANLYLLTNEMNPFGLGSTKDTVSGVSSGVGGPIDCTFWGLKICDSLIYTNRNTAGTNDNAGAGTTQTRRDGQTITDNIRYFAWEGPGEICRMLLKDSPAAIGVNSLVSVSINNVPSPINAFFCDNALTGIINTVETTIQDMGLICVNHNYGRGIAIGLADNVLVRRCNFTQGHQNIGAINVGTNYPIFIEYCNFSSTDACIYLFVASVVVISHCTFADSVAHIRLYYCNARIEYCFISDQGSPDYNIWSKNGGIVDIFQLAQDAEATDGGATKAMVYAVGSNGLTSQGLGGILKLDTLVGGRQRGDSAIVVLEDGVPEDGFGGRTCRFTMENTNVEDNFCTTIVRNNGQRWRGEVIASITPQRPTWIENTDVTGQGNVVSIHDNFTGVPRDGTWGKNANVLKVLQPTTGQFTEWRCTGTGTYGTPAAPAWYGLLPIDDGLSLAAYLQDTAYWAVPSMPAKGQGVWCVIPAVAFLNSLFGGAMPATPPGLYAGLAFRQAYRILNLTEMVGSNYTRVPTGAWTLTGAGAANATAITFPTAAADWSVVNYYFLFNSLVFFDAVAGGNYIGSIDIPPRTVTAGQSLSYAPGTVTLGRASSSLGSLADSVHAKMNGLWLNRVPFTAPSVFVALSTAPASLAAPAEPAGGGYARLATTGATWARNTYAGSLTAIGVVTNALPLTFAAPIGGWGTVQSVYLMDAASGGNVLGSANLTVPRTILSGSPARSFAVGALWISRS